MSNYVTTKYYTHRSEQQMLVDNVLTQEGNNLSLPSISCSVQRSSTFNLIALPHP